MIILGKEFRGFHVRFRDISRGGIRIVKSRDAENYDQNSDSIFDENYNLAFTPQKKNKDIPEGGSKGTILLNLEYQDRGETAFKKYIDGLLDILLPHESIKDYSGKEEILFLDPDEGTAEGMSWASKRAKERGYKFWKSISTGKSLAEGGIPHDIYGMTTISIHEYVLGILDKLKILEFELLWKENKLTQTPLSILTDQLSEKINHIKDSIHNSELWKDMKILKKIVAKHCPKTLVEYLGIDTILKRVPENYLRAIVASWLASHFTYRFGLNADEIDFHLFLK